MRLSFLLLALVAAATAYPKLHKTAGNVDVLKKQRDILILLFDIKNDIKDKDLRNVGYEYKIYDHLDMYLDQGVVKYLINAMKIGHIARKGLPYTISVTKLRMEIALLSKVMLCAKDYTTFLKTAAWARTYFNEEQFVKAFITTLFQRVDTKDILVLPAFYEIFPHYFFDARIIRKAQDLRARRFGKTGTKDTIEIPVDYNSWLPKGEQKLSYFTDDIALNMYYTYFGLGKWMVPKTDFITDDTTVRNNIRFEIGRGAQYYYVHQQIMAIYMLNRLSNGVMPIKEIDWTRVDTPFNPYLTFMNGLGVPGRGYNVDLLFEKKKLVNDVLTTERRLVKAIDSGYVITKQGTYLPLYNKMGVEILGTLMESTGRSMNPRYYGVFDGVARQLLGGAYYTNFLWDVTPSALEMDMTALRDPVFYRLFARVLSLFKRYQNSLPMYKVDDVKMDGVKIEDVKFDKLVTFFDDFKVDIDAATIGSEKEKENLQIKAIVKRLNHDPYMYRITVNSDKPVNGAVVRVLMGPKYDLTGKYVDIKENRHMFFEIDQFKWNLLLGKTIIKRNSIDAPMRTVDFPTTKNLLRKVEDAMSSHEPFYGDRIAQMTGFPERLSLPKGTCKGFHVQIVVIISDPKMKTITYGPVLPEKFQTYQNVEFGNYLGDYTKEMYFNRHKNIDGTTGGVYRKYFDQHLYGKTSAERSDLDTTRDRTLSRFDRSIDDDHRDTHVRTEGVDETLTVGTDHQSNEYLNDYYKNKFVFEKMGGVLSLDGRPLGFPLDRPICEAAMWVSNIKVTDFLIYHKDKDCEVHH